MPLEPTAGTRVLLSPFYCLHEGWTCLISEGERHLCPELLFFTGTVFFLRFFLAPLLMDKSCYLSKTMSMHLNAASIWNIDATKMSARSPKVYEEQWHAPGYPQYVFLLHQCQQPADFEGKVCRQSRPVTKWTFGLIVGHHSFLQVHGGGIGSWFSMWPTLTFLLALKTAMRRCRNFLCLDYFLGTRRGLLLHLEESKNVSLVLGNVSIRGFLVDAIQKLFFLQTASADLALSGEPSSLLHCPL